MRWPRAHVGAGLALAALVNGAPATAAADEEQPSVELLEFLGSWEQQRPLDPARLLEMFDLWETPAAVPASSESVDDD